MNDIPRANLDRRRKRIAIIPHVGHTHSYLLRAIALQQLLGHDETLLIVPSKAEEFCRKFFPDLQCKWMPWNFGHSEIAQFRFSEVIENSKATALEIERLFDAFRPDIVIGLPGFYSSLLCRMLGIPHVAILHGPWLAPEYSLGDLTKEERMIFDKCHRLFEIMDVFAKIVTHALGYKYEDYDGWLQREHIWIGQDFTVPYKSDRPKIGFLATSYGPSRTEQLPDACISICFGSALVEIRNDLVLALSRESVPLVIVSENRPENLEHVFWSPCLKSSELASLSSAAVTHAGISTMAIFAVAKVPQIFFPHDIDQAMNAILGNRCGYGDIIGLGHWKQRTPFGRIFPEFGASELQQLVHRALARDALNAPELFNNKLALEGAMRNLST